MITLITGAPGAGKTALAMDMLLNELGKRPLFTMGIPELKIEHQAVPPIDQWTTSLPSEEDASILKPVFTFPPNAIILIDEAQNVYRPRNVSSKVPDHVAAFETHRHTGVDFWLITQHPSLLDPNIKRLVGRHVHIRNTALGRYLYEWPEVGDGESKSSREISASRKYKLPRRVFGVYKSASLHIKQKRRLPTSAWIVIACLLSIIPFAWYLYGRIQSYAHPAGQAAPARTGQSTAQPGAAPGGRGGTVTTVAPLGVRPLDFQPVVPNRPETAPIFDSQRQVQAMEWPDACVASKTRCACYSGQGTLIKTVDEPTCRDIVAHGRHNPYKAAPQYAGPAVSTATPIAPAASSVPQIAQIEQSKPPETHVPFGGMKSLKEEKS